MNCSICDCIATANSPEFIRAKNEEYRKGYEKAFIVDQDFQHLYR